MTRTPEEIATDEVMQFIEHMEINPGWPEYEAILGHLTAMHKLRDKGLHDELQYLCFAKYMDDDLSIAVGYMQTF